MNSQRAFAYVSCVCGRHLVDLNSEEWRSTNTGVYECTACDRPLLCRGTDGKFYYVGDRVPLRGVTK